jgi:hypothetical protein
MLSKLLTGWVAHHVTGGIGRYELPTYLVQWGPVIISNRYDIALRMPHTRYFFMDDDGLAITDQRTQPLQSVTIDCPSRAFRQMSCQCVRLQMVWDNLSCLGTEALAHWS